MIVLRVWYILSGRCLARSLILTAFAASIALSAKEFSAIFPAVEHKTVPSPIFSSLGGCDSAKIDHVWKVFAPYLAMQTVLFAATMWPFLRLRRNRTHSQVMTRLVREYVASSSVHLVDSHDTRSAVEVYSI